MDSKLVTAVIRGNLEYVKNNILRITSMNDASILIKLSVKNNRLSVLKYLLETYGFDYN